MAPVLVSLSGLPGTGKTTLAQALCRRLRAVHLRIDSIEHALRAEGMDPGPAGYLAAYAVAEDNLRLGLTVVTDCVNSLVITRQALRDAAARAGCGIAEVELVCSDAAEHRRRVEDRVADWPGQRMPRWCDVTGRAVEAWDRAPARIETAGRTVEACLVQALAVIGATAVGGVPDCGP
ncbi:MAG TPA: AAA family ATPase [Acetobacteraceae bacterium]